MKNLKGKILLASACLALVSGGSALFGDRSELFAQASAGSMKIAPGTIGGVVRSAKGPEAGVWVIAETYDLPNRFIKIVVTDDQGRYVLPDLPNANFKVWARGYGLVDSKQVAAKPGRRVNLTATVAPDEKAAAQYYPASYWYSMLNPPKDDEFIDVDKMSGKGIPAAMLTGQHFTEQMKEKCLFCHQVGSPTTRLPATPDNSVAAWDERMQRWPQMHTESRRLGHRGLQMLSEWTNDIAAGKTPREKPRRPEGVERNVVLTVIGWGDGVSLHDQTSSDRLAPTTNQDGTIYGMATGAGLLYMMNPKTTEVTSIPVPGVDGEPHAPRTGIHASEMDDKGRVWMASVGTSKVPSPTWCSDGSTPSSKYFPLTGDRYKTAMPLPVYDPKTKKITNLGICGGGNHGHFDFGKDKNFYLTHGTDIVSWINTRVWDETKDLRKAFQWCPMVLDTSGDGKIDPDRTKWTEPAEDALGGVQGEYGGDISPAKLKEMMELRPAPGKDLRISRYLYGIGADNQGGVWAAAYVPYVPSGVVHMIPGDNPPLTCKTEYYEPPMKDGQYLAVGARGVGSDLQGRAWVAFSSGQIGLFDRRQCKVTNGPKATGQHCPEGWTIFDLPVPKVTGNFATSDMAYSQWPDHFDVMGLGKDTHFFPLVNSDSIVAMKDGSKDFITFRVPYPMGFYTRGLDFRQASANADWKGRTFSATSSSAVLVHQEGGMERPGAQEYIFQIRPDPLAH